MSSTTQTNGSARPNMNGSATADSKTQDELLQLNLELKNMRKEETYAKFHGDDLIGDKYARQGFIANLKNSTDDF
ncbi:hypothetical protein BU16DRAFT_563942 [Lophium mytilinum]|uniref:Uncharacterized protein n=1 Tax=Lophium mytilinum TaxID=390894 RepID=A0A6A6QKQ7_9PEZI|nr:hypothetical protein BU16DRAFT_563942 [Lophium mytilinum]